MLLYLGESTKKGAPKRAHECGRICRRRTGKGANDGASEGVDKDSDKGADKGASARRCATFGFGLCKLGLRAA
jgi:hypothetical protein